MNLEGIHYFYFEPGRQQLESSWGKPAGWALGNARGGEGRSGGGRKNSFSPDVPTRKP